MLPNFRNLFKDSEMSKHYSIARYDKNLCLKPNLTMWLISLFLLQAYIVLILSVVNLKDRTALIDLVYPDRLALSLGALAGIPAALVAYAWVKRNPRATPFVKSVWNNGRALLAGSALLNAVLVFVPLWLGTMHSIPPRVWVQLAIALLIVVVVYTSSYIRDCFADFPVDEAAAEKQSSP